MNNRKTPRIRFKGYTDDWEQRKLGDIVGIYDGVHQTPNYQNSGVMFLSVENIATLKSSKFISEEDFKRDYKVFPQEKDILMTRIGDVGTTNVVTDNGLKAYYVSLALLKYKSTDPYFLSNAIQSDYVQKGLANRTLKTAIPMKINKDEIGKVSVMLPLSATEQQQIGTYFRHLDHLITLHQRKLAKLKIVKKAMLENCFPKNGEKVPKFRFSGFTGDWEQRKLGKVFEEYSEKNHEDLPTLMIIQGGGTIRRDESDRSLLYDKANLANYKMVNEGDFIVHLRSFEGGLEMATNTGIISPAYHTFHGENTDSRFYYSYFRSKKFIDIDLKPHVYGIRDGRSIDIEGMKTVKIPFTSYEEQKAIGMFIKHLDHLITLHQRKLEKLKIIKKSFLEKMFV